MFSVNVLILFHFHKSEKNTKSVGVKESVIENSMIYQNICFRKSEIEDRKDECNKEKYFHSTI